MGVARWDGPAGTIVANARHDNGAFATADPRLSHEPRKGTLQVLRWEQPSKTIIGHSVWSKGFNVADNRPLKAEDTPIIFAADGTWHRPLTTLELAALQGFPTQLGGEWLVLAGTKKQQRQKIGNAVPPPTAQAIAVTALRALLSAELGAFEMSMTGWWVEQTATDAAARDGRGVP